MLAQKFSIHQNLPNFVFKYRTFVVEKRKYFWANIFGAYHSWPHVMLSVIIQQRFNIHYLPSTIDYRLSAIKYQLLALLLSFNSLAQTKPQLRFLDDSIQVGRPFRAGLSFRHQPRVEVFFPDTAHDFKSFTVLKQENFSTITENNQSLDSAIYTLITFELDTIQSLKLPVWIIANRDCTAVYSQPDSIILNTSIRNNSSAKLKEITFFYPLKNQINYPLLVVIILSMALVSGFVWLFFRKTIQKQWLLFQLYRRIGDFERNFSRLARSNHNLADIQEAMILWKKYMQRTSDNPFITFTSREIIDNLPDERLSDALRVIDELIYGGVKSDKIKDALKVMQDIASETYQQKRLEITQPNI